MKQYLRILFLSFTLAAAFGPVAAHAKDFAVAGTMQRCNTNEDCALVSNSCSDNCAYVPVSRANIPAVDTLYQNRCGKPMSANPACTMNPPLGAACINNRCTIDYAYANHAGPKDYKPGAYPVPEKAVPDKVKGDYSGVNDRKDGFSAYNLPQGEVRQDNVGQIVDRVYVPPSAPVQGGNYVPMNAQQQQVAPRAPASVPAAAVPGQKSQATPTDVVPAAPAQAPAYPAQQPVYPAAQQPQAAPVSAPAPAVPPAAASAYPTPSSAAYNMEPRAPLPMPEAVNTAAPAAPLEYVPREPNVPQNAAAIPAVGAPGVPQAPPGSKPIPPSDLKPAPTFVPPTGAIAPVGPNDPGAPPPPGTTLVLPTDAGKTSSSSFGGLAQKQSKYSGNE